jgi:hypothetical protein
MSEMIDVAINEITITIKKILMPFIQKIETTNIQYQTLVNIMSNMPEFQSVIKENDSLKEQIKENATQPCITEPRVTIQPEVTNKEPVVLEITQLINNSIDDNLNIIEHVRQIYDTCKITDCVLDEEAYEEEASEAEESDEEASEADEEEEAEESDEEASEEDEEDEANVVVQADEEEEEDASVADEEAEEADEEEEANAVVQAEEADEEADEASEADEEEEEASEADEEEEEASEADEEREEDEEEANAVIQSADEANAVVQAASEAASEAEEEEEEVFIVTLNGVDYYTSNETNGEIYSITSDEDVGDKVGQFISGKAIML